MARQQFAISFYHHTATMTLILISVMLLLPFYCIPQFAWSQLLEETNSAQTNNAYMEAKTEHVQVGDISIAYKRFGQGKPILFIPGVGATMKFDDPTLLSDLVATNHSVIVFDNRGMGETTIGTKPFSIEQFANDAAGLLDALQIEKADVLGGSLGSFVAQELALNYPQKVDRLILAAGSCGGNETIGPSEQTLEMLNTLYSPEVSQNMTGEQQAMILAQIMFPPEWLKEHPEILNNTIIQLAPGSSTAAPEIIQQQGLAAGTWKGSCDRLSSITQRTLLIVGDQDLLMPAANSIMMAQRIPNSWLVIIQGTGHGIIWQVPNEFSAIIQTFLDTAK